MSPILIIYLAGLLVCWLLYAREVWTHGIENPLASHHSVEPHNLRASILIATVNAPIWPGLLVLYLVHHLAKVGNQ